MLKETIRNIKSRYITMTHDELNEITTKIAKERLTRLRDSSTMTEMVFMEEIQPLVEDAASQILMSVEEQLFTFKSAWLELEDTVELPKVIKEADLNTPAGLFKYATFINALLDKFTEYEIDVDLSYHSSGTMLHLTVSPTWLTD